MSTMRSTAHEAALRRHAHQVVEVRIDVQVLAVAALVAAVHVNQRDVERERGHRDELLAVGVRRTHRAQVRVARASRRSRARRASAGTAPATPRPAARAGTCLRRARSCSPRRPGGRCGSAARARSSRATRTRRRPRVTLPARHSTPTSGPPYDTMREVLHRRAASARTNAIGLRRDPQPPMPTVMPSCTSATTSSIVTRLSGIGNGNSQGRDGQTDLMGRQIVGPGPRSRRTRAIACPESACGRPNSRNTSASGSNSRAGSSTTARSRGSTSRSFVTERASARSSPPTTASGPSSRSGWTRRCSKSRARRS